MDKFVIHGGRPLKGALDVHGSKNAALPVLIASLLTREPFIAHNVPDLRDIRTTRRLLEHLGKRVEADGHTIRVEERRTLSTRAPYALVKQMRASVLVAGPLLARFGKVRFPLPGGCAIGLRPIDIHLDGLEALGGKRSYASGDVVLASRGLKAARVPLRFPSVGATENLMMAAALIPGETVIENAAREPEIADLADCLNKMGARVEGAGGTAIKIRGAARLSGAEHTVIPDRIEAGTLLICAAAAGGELTLRRAEPLHLGELLRALKKAGFSVASEGSTIRIAARRRPRPSRVATAPYPGFPTDLQAPWMALMCLARGKSVMLESVFEKRFMHAAELARMGARIAVAGDTATIEGGALVGAPVMASDLRAGAALVAAGLAAKGRTDVSRVYHVDRGYERLEERLRSVGAHIERVKE